jgi:hypothetical protein
MPDLSVTSGTGLRNADDRLNASTTDQSAASGVYLCFVNIAKQVATTTPAIYGRAGWIPVHHQPCGRAGSLHDKHNGRARAGCLSTTCRVLYVFPPHSVQFL